MSKKLLKIEVAARSVSAKIEPDALSIGETGPHVSPDIFTYGVERECIVCHQKWLTSPGGEEKHTDSCLSETAQIIGVSLQPTYSGGVCDRYVADMEAE